MLMLINSVMEKLRRGDKIYAIIYMSKKVWKTQKFTCKYK